MADRTLKQWYDYHLGLLKKDPNMKSATEQQLKDVAQMQAQQSYDAQEQAKTVVGRNVAGSATSGLNLSPTPTPTPTPSISPTGDTLTSRIGARLSATMPEYRDVVSPDFTVNDVLSQLTKTQKKTIAAILDKAGFTIRTPEDVDTVIAQAFSGIKPKSYADLLNQINENLYTFGKTTGPSTSLSITDYGQDQIDKWIDDGLRKKFGRSIQSLNDQELTTLRKAVSDYASTPAISTVTKDALGRSVTKTQPGATTTGVENVVTQTGMGMFGQEGERRKAFEFMNELQKIMSGGM